MPALRNFAIIIFLFFILQNKDTLGQTFSFQNKFILINSDTFKLCKDTFHPSHCDSIFLLNKLISVLGQGKYVKHKKYHIPHVNQKAIYYSDEYRYDSIGLVLEMVVEGNVKKRFPAVNTFTFNFWRNDSLPIIQNIKLYDFTIANNFTDEDILNKPAFAKYILVNKVQGTSKVIAFDVLNNNIAVDMTFIKRQDKFVISQLSVFVDVLKN